MYAWIWTWKPGITVLHRESISISHNRTSRLRTSLHAIRRLIDHRRRSENNLSRIERIIDLIIRRNGRFADGISTASCIVAHIIQRQDSCLVGVIVVGDWHAAACPAPMPVQLQYLGFDKLAFDPNHPVAGVGVQDPVGIIALHEEAECANVSTKFVGGAEAGDVGAEAVDGGTRNLLGEVKHHACYIILILAEAVEAAPTINALRIREWRKQEKEQQSY